jgi:hypothetical protein
MSNFCDFDDAFVNNNCLYYDVTSSPSLNNSIVHLNIRSLVNKINELTGLLHVLDFPKIVMLSETWINANSPPTDIDNYIFVSSPRSTTSMGGGVGIYVHNSITFSVKTRSCDQPNPLNIDYILIHLAKTNIFICCLYCPPKCKLQDIILLIESLRSLTNQRLPLIIGGDFNVNLLDDNDSALTFLNSIHSIGLHPTISLPTRVSENSSTLIDNFLCDFSLLPVNSSVIKTDLSDHFMIELPLKDKIIPNIETKRNYCLKNKLNFHNKLQNTNWSHLYSINDTNKAFNYFIKKFKRIYNISFPYQHTCFKNKSSPWLTTGILKSIKHKNKLFIKTKSNPDLISDYNKYRNKLTNIIRIAKLNYHKTLLFQLKNNAAKLWSHLKLLSNAKIDNKIIPITPNFMNDFFTSVFKQAPTPDNNLSHTIPNELSILNSFYLNPITPNEIIITTGGLSNSHAIGNDGIRPDIIKSNIDLISTQLSYIFNLSFSQGIFPTLLKTAIIIPIHKSGSLSDPNNYRPISILTTFAKILEKLYYNRLVSFSETNNLLHSNQFGFSKHKSTSTAAANVLSSLISKCNCKKK